MTIRLLYLSIILLVFSYLGYGQSQSPMRSKQMKSVYSNPQIKVKSLLDSADVYMKVNRDRSFDFLEQAYLLSLKPEFSSYYVIVLRKLGDYYEYYKQHQLAAINYENSLVIKGKIQSQYLKYSLKAGEEYRLSGKPEKSIELYSSKYFSRKISPKDSYKLEIALGDAYFDLGNNQKALTHYKKAEQITAKLNLGDENTTIKLKIAKILSSTDKSMELEMLHDANTQSKVNSNKKVQIETETELADYYNRNNLYEQEVNTRNSIIIQLDSNIDELESTGVDVECKRMEEQVNIAKTYNIQNQFDSTLLILDKKFTPNKEDNIQTLEIKKEAAKTLSEAYSKSGDEEKAMEIYEDYVSLLDHLYARKEIEYKNLSDLNSKLTDHQWRIYYLEKDKALYDAELLTLGQEQMLQEDKLKFQKWYIILLVVIVSLLIFALVMMFQRSKVQRKHNLMLDLKALRTQMNPHFIFNALNSVNNFIAKNDELNANKYLVRFSKLMRSVLDNSDSDFISLSKEIEVLDLYLQLENMRFPDKFSYEFNVDSKISVDDFKIPPMLIQPYIENAIWHGLRYKEDNGLLNLTMKLEGDYLKVCVEDNGIGRTESEKLKTVNQKSTKSRGIKNTQKRLEILSTIYKEDIRIEINDVEANGSGTKVELWIPKVIAETSNK